MDTKKIEATVLKHITLIEVTPKSRAEAQERAGDFLKINYSLAVLVLRLEKAMVKLETLMEIGQANAFNEAVGKNVTEKRSNMLLDATRNESKEVYKEKEAVRNWAKTSMKIFENAHIMYRNLEK